MNYVIKYILYFSLTYIEIWNMRPVRQINESIINVQTRLRKKTQGAHREGYQFFPVAVAVSDRSYVQLLRYQSESHVHSMIADKRAF